MSAAEIIDFELFDRGALAISVGDLPEPDGAEVAGADLLVLVELAPTDASLLGDEHEHEHVPSRAVAANDERYPYDRRCVTEHASGLTLYEEYHLFGTTS